jgi:hypothetical protein
MANLINEAEIRGTWAPIIEEATGINESSKLAWMSEYCHNHKLYEDANIMSLNPGMNLAGMGNTSFPTDGANGSGDKAPTLLPLAMQVAAQTIGLDLVPVVPMAGPMGLLSYLDFVYEGGTLGANAANGGADGTVHPTYIRTALAESAGDTKVGTSRIDGLNIIKLGADTLAAGLVTVTYADAELVPALEDHIPEFSGAKDANALGAPMSRGLGESTPDKVMGLSLFSKSVAAETFQVAAAVTREQVQDLKQFGVDAIAQVEAVLTNELTQSINNHILLTMRSIAGTNLFGLDGGVPKTMNIAVTGGETKGDSHRRILTAILAAGNLIAQRGRRGAGNFAVVGGKVASALQGVAGFVAYPMANTINQVAGAIYPLGSIAGINVYTDPSVAFDDVEILVGRKGDGNGPGLVFMPYLMAESVQTIVEGTMAPKVAVKSRYALVQAGFHPGTQYEKFSLLNFEL